MGAARIVVRLYDGELIVHEFSRSTAQPTTDNVRKLAGEAMGWLQAWSAQADAEQWRNDVERALQAQNP